MRKSKKILAMLMVLSLCLTMIPLQVFAGEGQPPAIYATENDGSGGDGGEGGGVTPPDEGGGNEGGGVTPPDEGGGNEGGGVTPPDEGNGNEGGGNENGGDKPKTYTISFEYNDGTTSAISRTVTHNETIPNFPEAPTRKGYVFKGWYDGSKQYTATTKVTSDVKKLTAKWEAVNAEKVWTITFEYGKATSGNSKETLDVKQGSKVPALPTPKRTNYTFGGWFTKEGGQGTQYKEGSAINANVKLYAYWKSGTGYTVSFDFQGGTGTDSEKTRDVEKDAKLGSLPKVTMSKATLVGWFTKKDGLGEEYTKDTKITKDVKLYAYWINNGELEVNFNYQNATGGDNVPRMGVEKNERLSDLPTPTRDNYTFGGWYTERDGEGDEITTKTKITKKMTVYAYWTIKNGYTVTFDYHDATGGTSEKSREVVKNDKLGTLPNPSRTGYTFKGWYTDKNGTGEQVSSSTKVTGNMKLYAYFIENNKTQPNPQPQQPDTSQKGPFNDVQPNDWFCKPVEFVTGKKLFSGMGEGNFAPQEKMTRGMFVTVLGKLAEDMGFTTTGYSSGFGDVPQDQYYAQYVAWAASNEIVGGYSEWQFGPNDEVTREQMASLFVRFCKYANIQLGSGGGQSFSDQGQISAWASTDVDVVVGAGLMQGSDGNFNPKGSATRAEGATVFMNLSEKYIK